MCELSKQPGNCPSLQQSSLANGLAHKNSLSCNVKSQSPFEAFKPLRLLTVKLFDFPCFSPLKCEVPVKTNKPSSIRSVFGWPKEAGGGMEVKPRSKEGPVHNTHNNQCRQSSSRRPGRHFTSAAAYGQTEECRRLIDKLDAIEEVNAKILRSQTQMQENFVKVILFLRVVVIVATCDQALIANLHHS